MLIFLSLIGVAITFGIVELFDDDDNNDSDTAAQDDVAQANAGPDMLELAADMEGAGNLIVDSGVQEGFEQSLTDLVAQGDVTQAEADQVLASAQIATSPFSVETGDGDDVVFAGAGADEIETGLGDDAVLGGIGDDTILLGAGSDQYGVDPNDPEAVQDAQGIYGSVSAAERGNDSVTGNRGDDSLFDGFGSNTLDGGNGNDIINSVDQGDLSVDTVIGGLGNDTLTVDQGDDVTTGTGRDEVIVDLVFSDVGADFLPTIIQDFDPALDTFALDISGDTDMAAAITVTPLADGAGSSVLVNGTVVARLVGETAIGLTAQDLMLDTQPAM